MTQPYLLIVSGPTASGKSSLKDKTINHLDPDGLLFKAGEPVKVVIDDIIENQSGYYRTWVTNELSGKNIDEARDVFNNPQEDNIKKFSDTYFKARLSSDCPSGDELTGSIHEQGYRLPGEGQITCESINNNKLDKALDTGTNILLETTGVEHFSEWLYLHYLTKFIEKNYFIIYSYSLVDLDQLIKRNKTRAIDSIETWYPNKDSAAVPRLPDIRLFQYILNLMKTIDVFLKNRSLDSIPLRDKRLLVFDNSGKMGDSIEPIYDSLNTSLNDPNVLFKYFGKNINKGNICGIDGWKGQINSICDHKGGNHNRLTKKKKRKSIKRLTKKDKRKSTRL